MVAPAPAGVESFGARELGPPPPAETRDHEVVAVLNQLPDRVVRQRAIEGDGDPMPLVEVVSGSNGFVAGPEALGELRIALDAHLERAGVEQAEREHLARHLEHRGSLAERELFRGSRLRQARSSQRTRGHQRPTYTSWWP